MKAPLLLIHVFLGSALASDVVCVRNLLSGGTNFCESFPDRFAYLHPADPKQPIETCTRIRPASLCSASADFTYVTAQNGDSVCVLQWDTGATNYCVEDPKRYSYIFRDAP